MNFENLLVVAAILAFAFVNLILPWLRRQRRGTPADEAGVDEADEAARAAAKAAPPAGPGARREASARAPAPQAAATPRVGTRTARRLPLGSRAQLRQGIVLRTVLGPCRAMQDPNSSER